MTDKHREGEHKPVDQRRGRVIGSRQMLHDEPARRTSPIAIARRKKQRQLQLLGLFYAGATFTYIRQFSYLLEVYTWYIVRGRSSTKYTTYKTGVTVMHNHSTRAFGKQRAVDRIPAKPMLTSATGTRGDASLVTKWPQCHSLELINKMWCNNRGNQGLWCAPENMAQKGGLHHTYPQEFLQKHKNNA